VGLLDRDWKLVAHGSWARGLRGWEYNEHASW